MDMIDLKTIEERFNAEVARARTAADIEALKVAFLGKKSELAGILAGMKTLPQELRIETAKSANAAKRYMQDRIAEVQQAFTSQQVSAQNAAAFDNTLPGTAFPHGSLHPITLVQKEVEKLFTGMGFKILDGPEVEEERFNFEYLNIPAMHPARDMQDTYWLENGQLLRTHTSPTQVRAMRQYGAPLRAIVPGRCFRNEKIDPSHENTFFQLEGIMIDRDISIANLVYVMKQLLSIILERDVEVRLRPGFFPFVEPGFELDMQCSICGGAGCGTCHHSGWIELVPCGMVHPKVLQYGGIDPEQYTGFAFGLGLTRLAMMKYGINDIRLFNGGDLKQLKQF